MIDNKIFNYSIWESIFLGIKVSFFLYVRRDNNKNWVRDCVV